MSPALSLRDLTPPRILIADDHPALCAGLAAIILAQRPTWEICGTAKDGHDAVVQAVALRPNIVIMDYKMPFLNGLEAAEQIKARVPAVEILIFTGTQSPRELLKVFRSNVRGCLLKSEANEELIPALEALRRHHTFRSRAITELCEKIIATSGEMEELTERETEVLHLIGRGKSNKEIATELKVSVKTIDTHRGNLMRKLDLHSTADLVRYAIEHGAD
jgi:DNA-binding NarL/FixJ family response regulator